MNEFQSYLESSHYVRERTVQVKMECTCKLMNEMSCSAGSILLKFVNKKYLVQRV